MNRPFSDEYVELRGRGAFPNRIDPWAEAGRYFQQIHSGMIHHIQGQLQRRLVTMGYHVAKEASLQVFARREPDIAVQDTMSRPVTLNYDAVASTLEVESGTLVMDERPELEALTVYDTETGDLVTVVEIISPRNKTHLNEMERYLEQRGRLFLDNGVNVVEIDPTRSNTRLLSNALVEAHPYHIAIYLPGDLPRVLVSQWDEPLKPFALPLRETAIRVETQQAYDHAYQQGAIAGQIEHEHGYNIGKLPFPSLLTEAQTKSAVDAVAAWQSELKRLGKSTND